MNDESLSRFEARMVKARGDVEVRFEVDDERLAAIKSCLESGDLRMVLKDVDLDRLGAGDLGGGYLWD